MLFKVAKGGVDSKSPLIFVMDVLLTDTAVLVSGMPETGVLENEAVAQGVERDKSEDGAERATAVLGVLENETAGFSSLRTVNIVGGLQGKTGAAVVLITDKLLVETGGTAGQLMALETAVDPACSASCTMLRANRSATDTASNIPISKSYRIYKFNKSNMIYQLQSQAQVIKKETGKVNIFKKQVFKYIIMYL